MQVSISAVISFDNYCTDTETDTQKPTDCNTRPLKCSVNTCTA